MITLGLCCICNALRREGISFRTMTFARWQQLPKRRRLNQLSQISLHNSRVVEAILKRLYLLGIAHYRISSSLFPLLTHPKIQLPLESLPDFAQIKNALKSAGTIARTHGISLSMHPDQFVIPASDNPHVAEAALAELSLHGKILDLIGAPRSYAAPIHLHMGTSRGLDALPVRFDRAWEHMPESVRRRLVFENEDKGFWSAKNLLAFLKPRKIPMTFDFLHNACNPSGVSQRALFLEAAQTWGGVLPVFHYAESLSEKAPRAHAPFARHCPPDYKINYICELEAKGKDDALIALRAAYPNRLR